MKWITIVAFAVTAAYAQDLTTLTTTFGPVTITKDAAGTIAFEGKTVTGAPYSATAVTETAQVLADGNRITRKSSSFVARDSAGRTRREQNLDFVGPWASSGEQPHIVFIGDPVSGTRLTLEGDSHVALKSGVYQLTRQLTDMKSKAAVVPDHVTASAPEARNEVTTESLGSQVIDGIQAEGKRTTEVIPAGKIGNEKPIQIVNETWYSPELQTTVMSKHSDPRSGDVTYTLSNISRAEPDAALFQAPSDYKVRDDAAPIVIRRK